MGLGMGSVMVRNGGFGLVTIMDTGALRGSEIISTDRTSRFI
jgi:hypothetical protein